MKLVFDLKKKLSLVLWYVVRIQYINVEVLIFFFSYENQEKKLGTLVPDNDIGSCFR